MDITRQKAGRWRDRFVEDGLGGIEKDASRSGRIPSIGRRKRARIVKKTVEGKPPNATHWSRSSTGLEPARQQNLWEYGGRIPTWRAYMAFPMKPCEGSQAWRAPADGFTFKLSNDKQFVEKLEDVVGLYLNPPENAIVLSCDEKSQMQALDRTQPGLPLKKGRCGTLTHDYKRNGTTTMFAALNTLDGSYRDLYAEASSSGMDPVSQSDQTFRAERQTDPYHLRQLRRTNIRKSSTG